MAFKVPIFFENTSKCELLLRSHGPKAIGLFFLILSDYASRLRDANRGLLTKKHALYMEFNYEALMQTANLTFEELIELFDSLIQVEFISFYLIDKKVTHLNNQDKKTLRLGIYRPLPMKRSFQHFEGESDISKAYEVESKIEAIFQYWNKACNNKAIAALKFIQFKRKDHLKLAIKNMPSLSDWQNAIDALMASEFHNGKNDRGWVADFDFFINPAKSKYLLFAEKGEKEKNVSQRLEDLLS